MNIILNDVTLRDGLQNEPCFIPTTAKVKLANLIIDAGITHLELTSFVNPKLVPQLKDNFELATNNNLKDAYFSALVPNLKGFRKCLNTKIKEIVLFISACEKHNYKNLGKNIDNSLENFKEILEEAKNSPFNIRAAISMVFGSPFTKELPDQGKLYKIINFCIKHNFYEITLSDTWGNTGRAIFEKQLKNILNNFKEYKNFSVHLHDINGQGIVNSEISIDYGISKFDTSFNNLGGCPFSIEKGGNLNIIDFLKLAEKKNLKLSVNLEKLIKVEKFINSLY